MASKKSLPFFFLLTLLFALGIHARDSQFFNKITRDRSEAIATTAANNYYNSVQRTRVPVKEEDLATIPTTSAVTTKQDEPEPTFTLQTTRTGYGLYGNEISRFPPSATHTNLYNIDSYGNRNNYQNSFNSNEYYRPGRNYHDNNYNNVYNNANDVGRVQQQGMSDTRFLEGGKYFYDINAENNNDPNYNYYQNIRGVNMRGQYFNNDAIQGYRNQQEEEFEFDEP